MYLPILILLIDHEAMHKFSNLGTGQSPKTIISWADDDDEHFYYLRTRFYRGFTKVLILYIYNIYNI